MKKVFTLLLSICIIASTVGVNFTAQYAVDAANSRLNLPITFEDGTTPITQLNNVYFSLQGYNHITTVGLSVVNEDQALRGSHSLKIGPIRENNMRTELGELQMAGNSDFSNTDFSKLSGIMLRVKIADDNTAKSHEFSVALRQTGIQKPTWLGSDAKVYDANGGTREVTTKSLGMQLPAGFDGFVFLPLSSAKSELATIPGNYDSYQTYPEHMVDLSKDYSMQIYLNDGSWGSTSLILDDISFYCGESASAHIDFLRSLGYKITAVAQPEKYTLPMNFDELYNPFITVNNIYDETEHKSTTGVELVTGTEALNGAYSLKYGPFDERNSRALSTEAKMAANRDFSKDDFSKVTGIMMRIKITGEAQQKEYNFSLALRQAGKEPMWLGYGATAYDLSGNKLDIKTQQLSVYLPAGFDGFIFLPLDKARSQKVSTPGLYDTYQTYPDSMVNLAQDYTLQIYFYDQSWRGKTAYIDDICYYAGSDGIDHHALLKQLGYPITAVAQPSVYTLPMDFDNQYNPFINVCNIYDEQVHWANEGSVLVSGSEALNGQYSLKVGPFNAQNARTLSTVAKMAGNKDFSIKDFSKITGIMLRIKIADDTSGKEHRFSLALQQSSLKPMWLGYGAIGYDLNGNKVKLRAEQLAVYLPAGFDGFLFLPLDTAKSEKVTKQGFYDTYQTYPDSMVDLSKDYTMQFYFYDNSWQGINAYIDNLQFYAGKTHEANLKLIKSLGYNLTAVAQPAQFSFPLTFDDKIMPFEALNDVYDSSSHWRNSGVALVGGSQALSGTTSVKIGNFRAGNQRTETNEIQMAPLAGFSKKDFTKVTGILLRVKLSSNEKANYEMRFALNQAGMKKFTWLGNNAAAFDLKGNPIQLQNKQLAVSLPGGFDGYLFLPFADARSEIVTTVGFYDSYDKYPDSLPDLSKDYTLQLMFAGSGWDNSAVIIDDMRIYSGNEHIVTLKQYYKGITTVQQPDCYTLPFNFEAGITPFTPPVDGGLFVQEKGEHGTAGTVSYPKSAISNRTAMQINFAGNLTKAYSMYTGKAMVQGSENKKGFALRVKTNCAESATFAIMTDWLTPDSTVFGKDAVLYDMKGNVVDQPMEKFNWLGIALPANFDGFIFIPYSGGFIEKQNKYASGMDGWKFSNKQRSMQLIFYGEQQWQGKQITFDYFGEFTDTNYIGLIVYTKTTR